jgi:hypothetical protein
LGWLAQSALTGWSSRRRGWQTPDSLHKELEQRGIGVYPPYTHSA